MTIRSLTAGLLGLAALGFSPFAQATEEAGCTLPGATAPTAVQALCTFREGRARVRIGGVWGLIDADGRLAVPPQFDDLDDFSEGLALARRGREWGFIDNKGQWVIEPQFALAGPFSFKRARVTVDGKAGYIDETGKVVIAPSFAEGGPFRAGVALVREIDGTQVIIDDSGTVLKRFGRDVRVLPPNDFGLFVGEQGALRGLIRPDGEWAIAPTADPLPGDKGKPYIVLGEGANRRAIDIRGRVSTAEKPIGLMEDWPNWWWPRVEQAGTPQQVNVYQSFDFKERVRVPGRVLPNQTFMDGVLVVEPMKPVPGKPFGLYNHQGKLLGMYPYDLIRPMKEGFAVVGRKTPAPKGGEPQWRYGALDMDGRLTVPVRFEALGDFAEERAVVRSGGQYGLIDIQGKLLAHSAFTCDGDAVLLDAKKRVVWPEAARKKKLCPAK